MAWAGPQSTAPWRRTAQWHSSLFPFPLLHSRGTLASLAPQRKPRLEPGAGITHTAQGGFAWLPGGQVSRGRSGFPPASPASPSFLDLIWVPHTLFPAQPRTLRSDFASTFPGHAGQGAASSVPRTALATPGAPGGPPPAPCAAFPRGLSACPATGARGRRLTFAELRDTKAEPNQEPSSHRALHDPVSRT